MAAAEGSTVGFDQFVESVGVRVRRALVAFYGVEIGTDAAADAMRVAWESWPEVAGMRNSAGYLFRAGQSAARANVRWVRRRTSFPSSYAADVAANSPDDAELADLFRALARLNPSRRTAVVMVRSFGFSYRHVAEVLGVTEAAVTNHVHRGLTELRSLMEVTVNDR